MAGSLRDQLCAAHTLAWQQQRHEDEIALLRAIAKIDGKPLRHHRDTRDDFQKDYDEEQEGTYR
jgi:hypothetical protein